MFLRAECLKCTQKSCFGGFRVGKFETLMLIEIPLGNQSPAKHVIWRENDGDISLRLFSRAWQEITKLKNKKAQLSLTNPRDACETFARFT